MDEITYGEAISLPEQKEDHFEGLGREKEHHKGNQKKPKPIPPLQKQRDNSYVIAETDV